MRAILRAAAFAALLFILVGGSANAGGNNECAESAVACMAHRYEAADQELNEVYAKCAVTLDAEGKKLLKTAERAWIAFRDANAAVRTADWQGGFGSNPVKFAALADMTRERIGFLRRMSGHGAALPWEEKACDKPGQSNVDNGNCVEAAFQKADRELNQAYQTTLAKIPAEGKDCLKKAQRAWLEFRDADANFCADFRRGGTGYGAALAAAKAGMTRARTNELREVGKESE